MKHHADGEQPAHEGRRAHMNSGPQLTNRLEAFWQILGQQGILDYAQAQRFLGLLSPEPGRMKQPGMLSSERTRKLLRPWLDEGVLCYRAFYARQKGVFWLTTKGYKYAQLNLRYYEPLPSSLSHLIAVNNVRLLIAEHHPKDTWRSERELRAQQNANAKDSPPPHLPDAELISPDGDIRAIEVEPTIRAERRLEAIVFELAANKRYSAIWYYLPENVYSAVTKAVRKLPPEHRKRFAFFTLIGDSYPHGSRELTEESGA